MSPLFFKTPNDFRKWLKANHKKETELFVGFYKLGTGKPSITWSQAVDQALCFGWIDGIRRSVDKESYCNRFTPRRTTSNWSTINIKKVEELSKSGLMTTAGLKAYDLRAKRDSGSPASLALNFEKPFKKNKEAWSFFNKQAPSYIKGMINWIMSAKQEKTQMARLEKAIQISSQQKRMM